MITYFGSKWNDQQCAANSSSLTLSTLCHERTTLIELIAPSLQQPIQHVLNHQFSFQAWTHATPTIATQVYDTRPTIVRSTYVAIDDVFKKLVTPTLYQWKSTINYRCPNQHTSSRIFKEGIITPFKGGTKVQLHSLTQALHIHFIPTARDEFQRLHCPQCRAPRRKTDAHFTTFPSHNIHYLW